MAIYNDASAQPGTLVAQTNIQTTTSGVNLFNVQSPTYLPGGGKSYWLAYLATSCNPTCNPHFNTSGASYKLGAIDGGTAYTSCPTVLTNQCTTHYAVAQASIWLNSCPIGGPYVTATFSPTMTFTITISPTPTITFTPTNTPTNTPCSGRVVTTLAGPASFSEPWGIAVDSSGNIYVGDYLILEISPGGAVSTLAGSLPFGSANGTGTAASFKHPRGVAVDSSGNVYVADNQNNMIREISPGGVVTTLAGSGSAGSANGTGTAASFNSPSGVAVDSSGNVYVADTGNNMIREITSGGVVTTLAGSAAGFNSPMGVAVDLSGNVYVADTYNNDVLEISPAGVVTFLAGGFNWPFGIAVDSSGNVYVADSYNYLIKVIGTGGVVTTLAGSAGITGSTNGMGACATFNHPYGVAVDSAGNVYVADTWNYLIRKITQN